ncbi:gamma-tubulin complex component 6 [Diabrotica virgifera virgifera]|uniref:Gamma-tubulin complex component 6 n=1 Tax=Diabrotica virgifera virgifera TaxID=50390 RepID=A0ABM5IW33_DIAVI|nr:gamma-tubulin complex component 6 [Diabrotica virgifera virgifera]
METDEEVEDGVFTLITNLCEQFYTSQNDIKSARTKCYEILLKKRFTDSKKDCKDDTIVRDSYCNFLTWEFKLIHEFDMKDHAHELKSCVDNLHQSLKEDQEYFNRILTFLMELKNIPRKNKDLLDLSSLPPIKEFENFNKLFQLPDSFKEVFNAEENLNTIESYQNVTHNEISKDDNTLIPNTKFSEIFKDEGYHSPPKSPENIWELASKLKYNRRKTWENFGYPEPDKELPFLSELGPLSSLWVENLESLYMLKLFKEGTVYNSRMVPRKDFIQDLKYLLVGMASDSFTFDDQGVFYLVPGINVEAITPDALLRYCNDIMFTGTCAKALDKLSTPDLETGQYKYQGYVFTEFCESVRRYLKFYQTAIFNIPNSTTFLLFHEKTYQLRLQVNTLASVCKVGPYTVSEDTENGVALLNYLYHKVLSLTDQNVIYVLYSILYPCCQVYFIRFLKQWITEGTLNDPYGEFFVKVNSKYNTSRGRTYWTRSYSFKEDIIPDFLVDLRSDILLCGKSMSLLKFCAHNSKLRLYLMGTKPSIISCCVTLDQLVALRHNTTSYYLDVYEECGPRFSLKEILMKSHQDPVILGLISKKRAATLKRLELEREKLILEQNEKKMEEMSTLREQYVVAMEQKQLKIAREIKEEITYLQDDIDTELKRQKLVKKEAMNIIDYYSKLFEIADERKEKIDKHISTVKNIHIDYNAHHESFNNSPNKEKEVYKSPEHLTNSSTDSFYSIPDDTNKTKDENIEAVTSDNLNDIEDKDTLAGDTNLDVINANSETADDNANMETVSPNIQQAIDNFAQARENKRKVMTEELGMSLKQKTIQSVDNPPTIYISQAQRNKLRVLSSEFGIPVSHDVFKTKVLTTATINRNKVMGTSDCFDYKLDNENNLLNRNLKNAVDVKADDSNANSTIKKSKSLSLDLSKAVPKVGKYESDRQIPMSVDSTPMSDLIHSPLVTPSTTAFLSCDTLLTDSHPNTAEVRQFDKDFNFSQKGDKEKPVVPIYLNRSDTGLQKNVFSKRVSRKQTAGVFTNSLKLFLHESVQIPLVTQTKLINDELLRYFIEDLEYLKHISSLRDYFFLQDGEFGRNITDNLFKKLYEADSPAQLINCRTLQELIFGALDMSNKNQRLATNISFKINSLPKCFDLGNPDVLDCLSLTYKINWPLNILLPTDTIAKYDEVFKFLMKLNRVSWVLKKIFLELKVLARETGQKEIYLMASPQYRKLHQCRHIMTQFVQTLQNYVVGEVLQSNFAIFEKNLTSVTNLDELYETHTLYIKNILFMCLLSQKMTIVKNIIHKTFMVILKFFDYLRSRSWTCEEGSYVHPNFHKLESIFKNFQEIVLYMFKVIRKIAKSGYQPHLLQLLEMLDINYYFTKSLNCTPSSVK